MTDFKTKMAELAAKYNISHKRDIDWHNFVAEVEELTHPELALSEDEKMIIGLQGFLSAYGSDYFGTDGWQKIDDWLEKQKEQKPVENGGKELLYVSNKSYNIGYRDGKREAESKQEWSEEDEKMLQRIIRHTESEYHDWCNDKYGNSEIISDGKRSCLERLGWLENRAKSLRPQPREEIYQAAKHDLAIKFMNYLDESRPESKMSLSNAECEDIDKAFKENDWEKIMRYANKYAWKPSEEQMKALERTIRLANFGLEEDRRKVLESLYEQLNKL